LASEQAQLVVVVPTYNEIENIETLVARVTDVRAATPVDVLFVDPGRGVAQASGRSTRAMIASRFMRSFLLLHLRIGHQRSDAAPDARSGVAGRL